MTDPLNKMEILIVDDEKNMRRVLSAMLSKQSFSTIEAENGRQALDILKKTVPACIITDLKMPEVDGLELLERIKIMGIPSPVIMITAHGAVDSAVQAMKTGAFDYLTKPFDKAELINVVRKATNTAEKRAVEPTPDITSDRFIAGADPAMNEVMKLVDRVCGVDITVLISGETGTGKELIAKMIHEKGNRASKPFVAINCAAIPHDLTESELFGYEKGAFTGAVLSKPGRFELADGGTLFLDEIGSLDFKVQGKLLRAIQEQSFVRVGGIKNIQVDTRLVAATNVDLKAAVDSGDFREDLYYRLNVVEIPLPPLRERPADILPLAEYFVERASKKLGNEVTGLDEETISALITYSWPGNIRELENAMDRGVLMADSQLVRSADLPPQILESRSTIVGGKTEGSLRERVKDATNRLERQMILEALEKTGNNVTKAAQLLGLSRKGLQLKMKALDLRGDDES